MVVLQVQVYCFSQAIATIALSATIVADFTC